MSLETFVDGGETAPRNATTPEEEREYEALKDVLDLACRRMEASSADKKTSPLHQAALRGNLSQLQALVEAGSAVDQLDHCKITPLFYAVLQGQELMVDWLLSKKANVNAQGVEGVTPLYAAAVRNRGGIAKRLLEAGADPNATVTPWGPLLNFAAGLGHYNMVELLLRHGASPRARDKNEGTALHHAARGGFVEIAKLLLEHGAELAAVDKFGRTPLREAAPGRKEMVAYLLKAGANVDIETAAVLGRMDTVKTILGGQQPGAKGAILLQHAARYGHRELALFLIDAGVNVNIPTGLFRMTALHCAISSGDEPMVELLLSRGAAIDAEDASGISPLAECISCDQPGLARILIKAGANVNHLIGAKERPLLHYALAQSERIFELLIENGAELNVMDIRGCSALWYAVANGKTDLVKRLLDLGADVNRAEKGNRFGEGYSTPLHEAVALEDERIALWILEKNARIDMPDARGQTPVHVAASKGKLALLKKMEVTPELLNRKDRHGHTPLHDSLRSAQVVQWLLEKGAKAEVHAPRPLPHHAVENTPLGFARKMAGDGIDTTSVQRMLIQAMGLEADTPILPQNKTRKPE